MRKVKLVKMISLLTLMLTFGLGTNVSAMHISEGYIPVQWCVGWWVIFLPFLIFGCIKIKKLVKESSQNILYLAMIGGFSFLLSAMKLPSVTGSSSHPTGTGFGAVMFGPIIMSVIGFIVLLFQALLLAHGGIFTLGANAFSMAVVGPFVAYGIYKAIKLMNAPDWLAIFFAAVLADLATYITTALQLALAYTSSTVPFMGNFVKFMGVFAVTQIPLAIIEGILTVFVVAAVKKYCPESVGFFSKKARLEVR